MSESKPHKPQRIVLQAPRFGKSKKRLPAAAQFEVDEAVKRIVKDPLGGEPKTGALKGVRVVKFKVSQQQLLLAYQVDSKRNIVLSGAAEVLGGPIILAT